MAKHRQPFWFDGTPATLAASIDAHVELLQRFLDFCQMLLGAVTQGEIELPLIDHGIAFAQLIVALGFQAIRKLLKLLQHRGTLRLEPGARFSSRFLFGVHRAFTIILLDGLRAANREQPLSWAVP